MIYPILRRHLGDSVAAVGVRKCKGGIEALAVNLRAHPLHGHLVVRGGIVLAVVKIVGSLVVVSLAVIFLI